MRRLIDHFALPLQRQRLEGFHQHFLIDTGSDLDDEVHLAALGDEPRPVLRPPIQVDVVEGIDIPNISKVVTDADISRCNSQLAGVRAQPPGLGWGARNSGAESQISPVDRLRLLTAPSKAGGPRRTLQRQYPRARSVRRRQSPNAGVWPPAEHDGELILLLV